ncbi:hypothetical protein ElyMa_006570400 [Elysia marginata]|uniref:Uncharacterized protein n=1 Tax=Elysia marginata TaxID=1093978 RepID=A0AAV4IGX4_9GAST|nr:hypothetical protein ElyMa_006570400 [Elysia marginata]
MGVLNKVEKEDDYLPLLCSYYGLSAFFDKGGSALQASSPALWPSDKTLAQRSGGVGSFPSRVKPKTLKMVLVADRPCVWYYGFTAKPGVRIM